MSGSPGCAEKEATIQKTIQRGAAESILQVEWKTESKGAFVDTGGYDRK